MLSGTGTNRVIADVPYLCVQAKSALGLAEGGRKLSEILIEQNCQIRRECHGVRHEGRRILEDRLL